MDHPPSPPRTSTENAIVTRPSLFAATFALSWAALVAGSEIGHDSPPAAEAQGQRPLQARETTSLRFEHAGTFGGSYSGVAVHGTLAYASRGRVLEVLDVSDATAPRLIGQGAVVPAGARVVAAGPAMAYLAERDGSGPWRSFDRLHVVDARDPAALGMPRTLALTPSTQLLVAPGGVRLYAASGTTGITILDASNPLIPREDARVDLDLEVTGLAWAEGRLLTAATDAQDVGWLLVLDGDDPLAPQPIGRVKVGGPTGPAFGDGDLALVQSNQRIARSGYMGGTAVVDLTDPAKPRVRGLLSNPMLDILDFARTPERLYVLEPPHGVRGSHHVWSYDPTRLTEAPPLSTYPESYPTWAAGIAAVGEHVLLAAGPAGLQTLRTDLSGEGAALVTDHVRPVLGAPQGIALADGRAYVTDVDLEFWVLEVSEPASLSVLGRASLTHELEYVLADARGGPITLRDGIAYVARLPYEFQYGGLHVFDVRDPTRPEQLGMWDPYLEMERNPDSDYEPRGGITTIEPPLLLGHRLWLAGSSSLTELDASDLSSPHLVQQLRRPGVSGVYSSLGGGIATDGKRLFLANRRSGVHVVDITTPGRSAVVDSAAMPGDAADVALVDGHLLAVGSGTGLRVLEADSLTAVRAIEGMGAGAIEIDGDTAFLLGGPGIMAMAVGDPRHPVLRGSFEVDLNPDYAHLAVDGDLVAFTSWFDDSGLTFLRTVEEDPLQEPTPGPTLTPWPTRTPGGEPPRITPIPTPTPVGSAIPGRPETPGPPATPTVARPRSTPDPLYLPLALAHFERAVATAPPSPQLPGEPDASATPPPIETPSMTVDELALLLRAEDTELPFGAVTDFTGAFVNGTEDSVTIIEPADASTWGWRVPDYRWVVEREDGAPVRARVIPRCGMMNPLVPDDFRTLHPDASWTLRPDHPWMVSPDWHWSFTEPGTYRVQLRYEVDKSREEPVFPAIEDLWQQTLEGVVPSTTVLVHVAPPAEERFVERLARRHQVPIGGSRAEAEGVMGEPDQVAEGSEGEVHLAYYLTELPADPESLPYPRSEHIDAPRVVVTLGAAGTVSEVLLLP